MLQPTEKPKWLAVAENETGVTEIPGPLSEPRIDEYLATVGMAADDDIPWCAAFCNWCLMMAGNHGTGRPNARSFLEWGVAQDAPQIGSVVVLRRGNSTWQGHVGFYLSSDETTVELLGGNQSNQVCVRRYPLADVLGYRWPENC